MALTVKQKQFVHAYAASHSLKEAAIRAGYAESSADVAASRLMKHPNVAPEINRIDAENAARMNITAERTLLHIARIAYAGQDDKRFSNGDRLKALDMLMKATGGYSEEKVTVQHISAEPPVIEIQPASNIEDAEIIEEYAN